MRIRTQLLVVAICGLSAPAALAGDLPSRFTLGRYIPADSWMFINNVRNPERAWVDAQIDEVFQALKESGIDRDLSSLIMSLLGSDEQRAEFEANLDKVTKLVKAVRWGDMFGGETVFAERIISNLPGYEYMLLARGVEGSAEANMTGLAAILQEIASWSEELKLDHRTTDGTELWSLTIKDKPELTMGLSVFRKGDVIGMVMGNAAAGEILALMSGDSAKRAIVDTARFRTASAQVKAPETAIMFFDIKTLLHDITRFLDHMVAVEAARQEGAEPKEAAQVKQMLESIAGLFDMVDYSVTSMEMDGRRELTHTLTRVQEGKEKNPLAKVILNRQSFKRFDQYIPAEATGFSIDAFIDLELLYQVIIDFIRQHIPDGAEGIGKWNEWLVTVGFDPQRDLFDWWSGEIVNVTLPPAVVTPMGGSDSVLMVRVKNGELARTKVNALIDFAQKKLQEGGQMLMVSPAAVDAEGFREVTHPMIMMMVKPVIGVKDEWLIIGTSTGAINKCLAVAAGQAPSIMKNKRFREEGLIPKGPVRSASFTDTSNFGQELGAALGIIGMVGGMATASMPDQPEDARQAKRIAQTILSTMMKLSPVLQKLDFYSSESAVTTVDGLVMRQERVVTYKGPPSPGDPQTAEAPGASP